MYEILDRITKGKGVEGDIEELERLSQTIISSSLCGLGQTAPNPVVTTLKYYKDEYEAHIKEHRCPAGSCKDLVSYYIENNCIGCRRCSKVCPVECITGELKEKHVIDQDKCIKCGACYDACPVKPVKAVVKR